MLRRSRHLLPQTSDLGSVGSMDSVPALFYERVCRFLVSWTSDEFKKMNHYFKSLCTRMEKTWLNGHFATSFDAENGVHISFGLSSDGGSTYVTKSLDDVPKYAHLLRCLEIQMRDNGLLWPPIFTSADKWGQWRKLTQSDLSKLTRIYSLFPVGVTVDSCLSPDGSSEFYDSGLLCQGTLNICGLLSEKKFAFVCKHLEMDRLDSLRVSEQLLENAEWTDTVFAHFFKSRRLKTVTMDDTVQSHLNKEFIVRFARMWASCASVGRDKKELAFFQWVFYKEFHNDLNVRTVDLDENTVEVTVHLQENPSRAIRWKELRDYGRVSPPACFVLNFIEI
ncbi:hypothetical protein QR680_003152 [Steinernema hermaphroditum]|uniref:Uncharacterized protein n=1 Tax=Steinernema hermaphroditum TaxID=289476 RepID=A0AA39LJR6_9BILA|nr:hypothetical protein QR680_003152 [Steinernema hermaphroditum]